MSSTFFQGRKYANTHIGGKQDAEERSSRKRKGERERGAWGRKRVVGKVEEKGSGRNREESRRKRTEYNFIFNENDSLLYTFSDIF